MAMVGVKGNSTETMIANLTENNRNYWSSFSKELTDSTRKVYQSDILNYLVWINKDITETTATEFEKYIVQLQANGVKENAINKKLSATRSFIKYLVKEGIMNENPLSSVKALEVTEQVQEKYILTWEQVQQCKDLGGLKYNIFEAAYMLGLSLPESANHADVTLEKYKYNIKKLGEEIGINNLKYMDLIDTRNNNFAKCPSCGVYHEMSEGNWKFLNGHMVCKDC